MHDILERANPAYPSRLQTKALQHDGSLDKATEVLDKVIEVLRLTNTEVSFGHILTLVEALGVPTMGSDAIRDYVAILQPEASLPYILPLD